MIVVNKSENLTDNKKQAIEKEITDKNDKIKEKIIFVSATEKQNIYELKELIGQNAKSNDPKKRLTGNLLSAKEVAVLVVPIDSAAPKGRLILPQQQVIRDVLERGAIATVCRESELKDTLSSLKEKPKVVITDSQAFEEVSKITPNDIMLTSFSILFSRYKGNLKQQVEGTASLDKLENGDKILISEGCTHHRQCDDIGRCHNRHTRYR